jgi:hypothetical protein
LMLVTMFLSNIMMLAAILAMSLSNISWSWLLLACLTCWCWRPRGRNRKPRSRWEWCRTGRILAQLAYSPPGKLIDWSHPFTGSVLNIKIGLIGLSKVVIQDIFCIESEKKWILCAEFFNTAACPERKNVYNIYFIHIGLCRTSPRCSE